MSARRRKSRLTSYQRGVLVDHYAKNYSVITLAEMLVDLEDQTGTPFALAVDESASKVGGR